MYNYDYFFFFLKNDNYDYLDQVSYYEYHLLIKRVWLMCALKVHKRHTLVKSLIKIML